jgi:hypothetical protein
LVIDDDRASHAGLVIELGYRDLLIRKLPEQVRIKNHRNEWLPSVVVLSQLDIEGD